MLPQLATKKECHVIRTGFAPKRAAVFLEGYPDLMNTKHVAELTGLSEQTIRAEINAGRLPGCRIGRRLFVPKQKFAEYVTDGRGVNGR